MVYYAFDLLHLDNTSLLEEPLIERKSRLEDLLKQKGDGLIRYSEHFEQAGGTMLSHACRMGLEGVISKQVTPLIAAGARFPGSNQNAPCARSSSSLAI